MLEGSNERVLQAADTLENVRACDASATSITTTTLADVAGLTFALDAGKVYVVDFDMLVNITGLAATLGVGLAYSGTASAVFGSVWIGNTPQGLGGLLTAMLGSVLLGAVTPISLTGRIRATTAGNLTLQAQRSAGSTATINGGCGRLHRV